MKKPRYRHPLLDLGGFVFDQTKAARLFRKTTENVEIVQHTLPISGLKKPLRLVQLSDFHASRSVRFTFLEQTVARALAFKPDLICLTGDYTTCGLEDWKPLIRLFRQLSESTPTFAVLGNHDGWPRSTDPVYTETIKCLKAAHITLLENRSIVFEKDSNRLQLVGTGDLLTGPFNPAAAFEHCDPEFPTILLTHNPDARSHLLPFRWNICLCGHTHGGQINLPGLNGRFTPIVDRRYQSGIFEESDRFLHVNKGVGSIGGVRFRARAEICVLDLTGQKA